MAGARYRAFLSCSARDRADGERLVRALEAYRLPYPLRGRETSKGPAPARLTPVFFDRKTRSGAAELSADDRAALADSDDLIVLCSRAAAQSKRVAAEVTFFQRLGKRTRIHAVLLDGKPEDASPPPLREGGEPAFFVADLRREKDGWTGGPLKVVASALGLPFEELAACEIASARRRVWARSGIAASCGALAAVACAAALIYVEKSTARDIQLARANDAILAQVAAIGDIVEDVAEDRRNGSLPPELAEKILARATSISDGLGPVATNTQKIAAEVARMRVQLSRHYRALGDDQQARRYAAAAGALDAAPSGRGPDPTRLRLSELQARGDAMLASGDWQGALNAFERGLATLRSGGSSTNSGPGRQWDISVALLKIGDARHAKGDPGSAVEAYRKSLAIRRELSDRDPGETQWAHGVALLSEKIGDVARSAGDDAKAEDAYREALDILRRLTESAPANTLLSGDLARSLSRMGDMRLAAGQQEQAVKFFEESLAIRRRIADQDDSDSAKARGVVLALIKVGDAHLSGGDRGWAYNAYDDSLTIARQFAERRQSDAAWWRDVIIGNVKLAEAAPETAQRHYGEALAVAQEMASANTLAEQDGWMLEELERRLRESSPGG